MTNTAHLFFPWLCDLITWNKVYCETFAHPGCNSYVKVFQKSEEHLWCSRFSNQPISKHWFISVVLKEGLSHQHLIVNTHSKVSGTSGQQVLVVIKSKQIKKKKNQTIRSPELWKTSNSGRTSKDGVFF